MKTISLFLLAFVLHSTLLSQTLDWAFSTGGPATASAHAMELLPDGYILEAGSFSNTVDFDPGAGTLNLQSLGGLDGYLRKMDTNHVHLWTVAFGTGAGSVTTEDIAVDAAGNILLGGYFSGTNMDFDPGSGTFLASSSGLHDGFILKLSSTGSFLWMVPIQGIGNDIVFSVNSDSSGNVIAGGNFDGTVDMDPGIGVQNYTSVSADEDAFVLKLDSSAGFVWARQFAGASILDDGQEFVRDAVVDENGAVYIFGWSRSTAFDLDPGIGTDIVSISGPFNFLIRLTSAGDYLWGGTFNAGPYPYRCGMRYGAGGNLYITASMVGQVDLDIGPGTYPVLASFNESYFIARLDNDANVIWGLNIETPGFLEIRDIDLDEDQNVIISGGAVNTIDLDPGPGVAIFSAPNSFNHLWTALDSSGTFLGAQMYGDYIVPYSQGADAIGIMNGSVFGAGYYESTIDMLPGALSYMLTAGGAYNHYVAKWSLNGTCSTTNSTLSPNSCGPYTSPSGQYTWAVSGQYLDTIPNSGGCDSLITIDLTMLSSTTSSISPVSCNSYTSPSGLYTWTASGQYADTLLNAAGCDSIIAINLTVQAATASAISPASCDPYTSPSGLYTWTASGQYFDTIPNAAGCDSIVFVNLTILLPTTSFISPNACNSYTSPSGLYTWNSSGQYFDTIPNSAGCDSIIAINLSISLVDTTVINSGTNLLANSPFGTYQWLNCDSNFSLIAGATNQTFTPIGPGNYALAITDNGCTDTSSCQLLQITSANAGRGEPILSPNPTSGPLLIDPNGAPLPITIEIIDIQGALVEKKTHYDPGAIRVKISGARTIYFLRYTDASGWQKTWQVKKQ